MITTVSPVVESVGAADLDDVGAKGVGAGEGGALTCVDGKVLPIAGGFAFTLADTDHRVGAVFAGFDAIAAASENGKRLIGGVNLEDVVVVEVAHVDVHDAGGELELGGAVIQIQKREAGVGAEADYGGAQLEFGAGIVVGPELVAGGHGTVGNGLHPFGFASGLEGDGTLQVPEAGDAAGRILLLILIGLSDGAQREQGCGEHQQRRRAGAATDIVVQKYEHRGEWHHGSSSVILALLPGLAGKSCISTAAGSVRPVFFLPDRWMQPSHTARAHVGPSRQRKACMPTREPW